ncbi:GAF domain-containing protein [Streptomyces sp. NPDC093252]|uniref:GAF domain-containing protein n=1 Tax=Streptomyces sp. NPDC093252 TaxID=3154980 RepID=UPI003413488A
MNPHDPDPGLLPAPAASSTARAARLHELGLRREPRGDLDETVTRLGRAAGAAYAMVNLLMDDGQYFTGLYRADRPDLPLIPRTMPLTHGFCPALIPRNGLALVITDTHSHARFRSNAVVDILGVRTYVGAPFTDPESGQTLATICFIDTAARPQADADGLLGLIKSERDALAPTLLHSAHR